MRLALSIALLWLVGCSGPSGTQSSATQQPSAAPRPIVRTNTPGATMTPANPAITTGRVAFLNTAGRFVILTYPLGKLPPVGKRLSVYREGMKVGELKVSEPQRDQNTAADITAGEAQAGDEVREN